MYEDSQQRMTAEQLKNSILQEAISGRLVPQDPNDEPAAVLLARIREEKEQLIKEKKLKKEKPSAPITEDEIPFEIPASWEWVRLGGICNRFSTGPFGTMLHKEDYVELGGHPLVNPTNIKAGTIVEVGIKKTSDKKYQELSSYILRVNDIVLARRGDLSKSAIVSSQEDGWLAGTGAFFLHLYDGVYFLPFFIYVYTSTYCQSYLLSESVGGTMDNLNQKLLSQMLVPLPPLAEQKRIVAKLEELLPIVEQYGKAQKELNELNTALPARLRQSILQEAISGKLVPQDENETADELVKLILDRKKALLKSGELERRYVKELPIDDSEFEIELPKGWCLCKLGNIARISAGGTPARGVAAYWSNGKIPWLKISDITASDKYVNSASEYITEAGMNNSSAKLMKKGTLLYTIFASIGEVGILNFEATCNQAIANIDLYVPEMTNYIYYYLKNLQAYMYSISKGCAQLNINQDILKNAIVPLPPLAEQQRIVAKIEELFAEIDKLK